MSAPQPDLHERRQLQAPSPAKRLTLWAIRDVCSLKVFKLGEEYRDRVADLAVKRYGTLTGTILGAGVYGDLAHGSAPEYVAESPSVYRAAVSLRTGRMRCSCPYSRVDVCSHVAALLICASKDLRVVVPAGGLPVRGRSAERTTLPYRKDADHILARAAGAESAGADLDGILELAEACYSGGDLAEALIVCVGVAESLLSGLDYQAYSGHFGSFCNCFAF